MHFGPARGVRLPHGAALRRVSLDVRAAGQRQLLVQARHGEDARRRDVRAIDHGLEKQLRLADAIAAAGLGAYGTQQ